MKYSIPSIILVTLFSLTACSSGNTASARKSYDPCKLLTADDVKALFPGGEVKVTQHDKKANPIGIKICFYSASGTDQKFAELAVTSAVDAPPAMVHNGSLRPMYDNERNFLKAADLKDVPGLGDAAYYGGSGLKAGAGLHVLDNKHGVKIDVSVGLGFGNNDAAQHVKIETTIVKKALARL
ncbi:MAG: hypothetical protein WB783_06555 [Arenicellales bacterium]